MVFTPATKTELKTALNKWYTIANGNDNGGYNSPLEYANSFTKTQHDTDSHLYPYYGNSNEWDVTNVKDMSYLFKEVPGIRNYTVHPEINGWDVSNVNNMEHMFELVSSFNQPIGNWNVSNVTNMDRMFSFARAFNQPIEQWNVSNVTNMGSMFRDASAFNQPLGQWNVGNVTEMYWMFYNAYTFNQPIGEWNVGNVTNIWAMFYGASAFNQPLEQWNVGNVTNMRFMFYDASRFNQPLEQWNVGNVTDMEAMFNGARAFNQPLGQWNVGNVTNMGGMFYSAITFNQPLEQWNVGNVTNMWFMFYNATVFNQALQQWNVGNVTDMSRMFYGATAFNQDIGQWDVSHVTNMFAMFYGAAAFNKNIGNWNMNSITDISGMFENAISFDNAGSNTIDKWFYNRTTESIIDFQNAFKNANNFNRKITAWNVREDDIVIDMLTGTGIVEKNLYGFSSGTPSYTLFNQPICFNKGTKILCYVNNKEVYVPIEKLRKDMLVKTYKHGYKKIDSIKTGTYRLGRSSVGGYDVDQGMYKMVKEGEMIADLEMTGLHSILVDRHDAKYKNDIENSEFKEKSVKSSGSCYVDNKYRLKSKHCSKFIKMKRQDYTIYTFSLEHEREDMLYGIWANGVLVETTPRCHINKMTGAKDLVDEIVEKKQ